MLEACQGPDSNADTFTQLLSEAYQLRNERRLEQDRQELVTRRRAARALFHKQEQEGATPSDEIIMDRESGQAPDAVSKAAGGRKALGCESSAIRKQDDVKRAS